VAGLFSEVGDAVGARDFFVERDSYAIAFLAARAVGRVTRWGLFLIRGVHFFQDL